MSNSMGEILSQIPIHAVCVGNPQILLYYSPLHWVLLLRKYGQCCIEISNSLLNSSCSFASFTIQIGKTTIQVEKCPFSGIFLRSEDVERIVEVCNCLLEVVIAFSLKAINVDKSA